jgi:hypothetical protein
MIQGCDRDALCEIHVIANLHRAYDGVVQTYSSVVADNHIAHSIINTTI